MVKTNHREERMAELPIRIYGDPVLRTRAEEIARVDEGIKRLAGEMVQALKRVSGIGLAANQVGQPVRLFVVDRSLFRADDSPLVVINPQVVAFHGEQLQEEGCLSLPGTFADVARPMKIQVKGVDLAEKELVIEAEGLLSRVLSHEIDHLNGVLFIDHLSSIKRKLLSRKLKKLSAG
jgi:peptide deformylase